jgi:hypothetical protein
MKRMHKKSATLLKGQTYESGALKIRHTSQWHWKHIHQNNSRKHPKSQEKDAHPGTEGL